MNPNDLRILACSIPHRAAGYVLFDQHDEGIAATYGGLTWEEERALEAACRELEPHLRALGAPIPSGRMNCIEAMLLWAACRHRPAAGWPLGVTIEKLDGDEEPMTPGDLIATNAVRFLEECARRPAPPVPQDPPALPWAEHSREFSNDQLLLLETVNREPWDFARLARTLDKSDKALHQLITRTQDKLSRCGIHWRFARRSGHGRRGGDPVRLEQFNPQKR